MRTTPDTMQRLLRQLSLRVARLEGRRPGPRAVWGHKTRTGNGNVSIVYPTDLFSKEPILLLTVVGAFTPPLQIPQSTKDGATITVTAPGTVRINWLALDANDDT